MKVETIFLDLRTDKRGRFAKMCLPVSKFWTSCFHNSHLLGAFHWRINSIRVRFAKIALLSRKVAQCSSNVDKPMTSDGLLFLFSLLFRFLSQIFSFSTMLHQKTGFLCLSVLDFRDSILYESLNVWMVCSSSSDPVNGKTFVRKRKNLSLALCVGKINRRDRCKHHSWIDRILRRQIANDLSTVLASLAIGGGNLDKVR